MFYPKVSAVIAKCEQEVIFAVMPRAEKFSRLGDKIGHLFLDERRHVQRNFAVRDDINLVMNWLTGRCEIERTKILAGDDGGIHQTNERNGLEYYVVGRLRLHGERCAEFPSRRKHELRLVTELLGGSASGIEHILIPVDDHELICC